MNVTQEQADVIPSRQQKSFRLWFLLRVIKDTGVNGLWNLLLPLRKSTAILSVHECLFHEAIEAKPGLCQRPQNVGAIRAIEYLLRRASEREWSYLRKRGEYVCYSQQS